MSKETANRNKFKRNHSVEGMLVRICHHDTQGLSNDATILRSALNQAYPEVFITVVSYPETELNVKNDEEKVDVQFFLEHVNLAFIHKSQKNIFITNPEWMNKLDIDMGRSNMIQTIVAKTKSGFDTLRVIFPSKTEYWGWTSIDRRDETIWKTYDEFLHIKGCSPFKNTQLLMDTWLTHPEWPLLHIVSYGEPDINGYIDINRPFVKVTDNIRLYQRKLSETELNNLMNRTGVHLCPSAMEGFGHYINEARSCGSLVLTTHGFPMSEFVRNQKHLLVRTSLPKHRSLGLKYEISQFDLEETIHDIIDTPLVEKKNTGHLLREFYDEDRMLFLSSVKI